MFSNSEKRRRIEKSTGISVYISKTASDSLVDWLNEQEELSAKIVEILTQYVNGSLVHIPNIDQILVREIINARSNNICSEQAFRMNKDKIEKLKTYQEVEEEEEKVLNLEGENPFEEEEEVLNLEGENPFEEVK